MSETLKTVSIDLTDREFASLAAIAARLRMSPADLVRQTAINLAAVSDGLALHGRKSS